MGGAEGSGGPGAGGGGGGRGGGGGEGGAGGCGGGALALYSTPKTAALHAPPSEYALPSCSTDGVFEHSPRRLSHDVAFGDVRLAATTRDAL